MNLSKFVGMLNLVVGTLAFIVSFISYQFNIGTERDLIFFGIISIVNLNLGLHLYKEES